MIFAVGKHHLLLIATLCLLAISCGKVEPMFKRDSSSKATLSLRICKFNFFEGSEKIKLPIAISDDDYRQTDIIYVNKGPSLTEEDILGSGIKNWKYDDQTHWSVVIFLSESGHAKFTQVVRDNPKDRLAIFIDNEFIVAPSLDLMKQKPPSMISISSSDYDEAKATALAKRFVGQ